LDTSVVLRLLTGEPPDQAERAAQFLQELGARGGMAVVSDMVVAESYYALHAHYGVPKREALQGLRGLLESGEFGLAADGCALDVLRQLQNAPQRPGFVDRLIHAQYLCGAQRVASFDEGFRKLRGGTVLSPRGG
jgi:predicted nucleic acid-binding protein